MSWHEDCDNFDSRIEASAKDANFNDTEFLLIQDDAEDPAGDKVSANEAILALISPVFYAQFYGPLSNSVSSNQPPPIEDGTARGFKQLIKFISNPISFQLPTDNVVEVFEISYFGHKYQIGSLVSQCRQLLGRFDVGGKELDILNWALSSDQGQHLKNTLTQEYHLLVNRCWTQIDEHFEQIFPHGEVKDGQILLDEGLMLEILGREHLRSEEHFILMVALDYYTHVFKKKYIHLDDRKRFKMDIENEWSLKLMRLKSVVLFDTITPKKFAKLFEKIVDKLPSTIISKITKTISPSWDHRDNFSAIVGFRYLRNGPRSQLDFDFDCSDTDWRHSDLNTTQITFQTNQNAMLHFYSANMFGMPDCSEDVCDNEEVNCCVQGTIKLQNEGHYKDEFSFRRTADGYSDYEHNFYVEANKKVTISYEKRCKQPSCPVHLRRMKKFNFSQGNFSMEILLVNGQPVASACYSFLSLLVLTPL